jgi:hypothetical protein
MWLRDGMIMHNILFSKQSAAICLAVRGLTFTRSEKKEKKNIYIYVSQ